MDFLSKDERFGECHGECEPRSGLQCWLDAELSSPQQQRYCYTWLLSAATLPPTTLHNICTPSCGHIALVTPVMVCVTPAGAALITAQLLSAQCEIIIENTHNKSHHLTNLKLELESHTQFPSLVCSSSRKLAWEIVLWLPESWVNFILTRLPGVPSNESYLMEVNHENFHSSLGSKLENQTCDSLHSSIPLNWCWYIYCSAI